MDFVDKIMEQVKIDLGGKSMEVGDTFVYVLNDGVVTVELDEGHELKINATCCGEAPTHLDLDIIPQ